MSYKSRPCRRCVVRFGRSGTGGYCRRCWRSLGLVHDLRGARPSGGTVKPPYSPPVRPPVWADGIQYEVVWDGR